MKDFFTAVLLKTLIDLIPGMLFSFATIVFIDINMIVGLIMYVIAYLSLNLHTYLINKYNLNN